MVAGKEQLTRLLITPESLRLLEQESKTYQRSIYTTLALSALLLYPLHRIPFTGFRGRALLGAASIALIVLPVWWVNDSCRRSILALKQRVFSENRPNFRKYELTGDILTANPRVVLVEE